MKFSFFFSFKKDTIVVFFAVSIRSQNNMQSTLSSSKCHHTNIASLACSCVVCNAQNLHVTPERFKDICLKTCSLNNDSSSTSGVGVGGASSSNCSTTNQDLNTVLEYFFEPTKKLNAHKNNVDLLKTYLIGTSSNAHTYENYKAKCKKVVEGIFEIR